MLSLVLILPPPAPALHPHRQVGTMITGASSLAQSVSSLTKLCYPLYNDVLMRLTDL